MAYQRALDNFRQTLLDGGFSAEEVKALKSEVVSNGYIPSAKDMVKERKEEEAARQDYREGERGGDDEKVAAWLAAEEARKATLLLSLPSNGAIGLIQGVTPPVTSLGYYDLITKSYIGGWENFSQAASILTNYRASFEQRLEASTYATFWGGAHVAGTFGSIILLRQGIILVGAQLATQNPDGVNTIIGGYKGLLGYENFAEASGNTYFSLGRAYNILDAIGLAKPINNQFITNQIAQTNNFIQTTIGGPATTMEVSRITSSGLYTQMGSAWSGFASFFTYTPPSSIP